MTGGLREQTGKWDRKGEKERGVQWRVCVEEKVKVELFGFIL